MCAARLITIPFSHYCEKARWGLRHCGVVFYEDGYLPLLHAFPVVRVGGRRTVPTLVVGEQTLAESSAILQWADRQAASDRKLYPAAVHGEVSQLEARFDEVLGPATRRWVYEHVFSQRANLAAVAAQAIPRWQAALVPVWVYPFVPFVRRIYRVNPQGVERSVARIEMIFAEVGERLADGRAYLVGEQFTAADLTFAALAAPALMPEGYGVNLPGASALSEQAWKQIQAWRALPAGAFALELYRQHRNLF